MLALIITLNGLLDELDCIKRVINIKTTLLNFPGKIISSAEIRDIEIYFQDCERKIDTYFRSFLAEKEKEAKSKKPKTLESKERFKEIEALFDKVKTTEKLFLSKAKYLIDEYNKKERELFSGQIIPRKKKVILNDGKKIEKEKEKEKEEIPNEKAELPEENKENKEIKEKPELNEANENPDIGANKENISQEIQKPNEPKEEEYLIIEKIFLNIIMNINDVDLLKKKETLDEEKEFISKKFNLKNLFENSSSKQYIMLDYYMNIYNLCIENNFTLQQISTIMSIFYFIFSYSFSWVSTEEKILEIFTAIISYHSENNPPFSQKIFEPRHKNLLINFFENTFIKNFSFFEVLFRSDVAICFFNQVSTKAELIKEESGVQNKIEQKKLGEEKNTEELNNEEEEENEENKKKEGEKSLDEIQDEKEIETMKNFINSFYQAVGDFEMQRARAEGNAIKGKNAEEANQAKMFLDIKLPEIKKDINDLIEVQTRSVIKPVDKEMAEKTAVKGGKK